MSGDIAAIAAGLSDDEFVSGYLDGRNPDEPEPSANRSHSYRHSFAIGRAEIANKPISAQAAREAAEIAANKDRDA